MIFATHCTSPVGSAFINFRNLKAAIGPQVIYLACRVPFNNLF